MNRFVKTSIAVAVATFAVQGVAASNSFNADQTKEIQDIVHKYLVKKPEVLMEAMQVLQKQQYEQAEKTIKTTEKDAPKYVKDLFHQKNDPMAGNPNGQITVVEFFDYQCPHCVEMAPVMKAIVAANKNVRVIYKDFPIRGPMSEVAARAALAANQQGKYNELRIAILENKQPLTEDIIFDLAKKNGINVDKLKKDMKTDTVEQTLKANMKLAQELKLFGTPAFFVGKTNATNGKSVSYIPGRVDESAMQKAIDKVK